VFSVFIIILYNQNKIVSFSLLYFCLFGCISDGRDVSKFCEESGPRLVAIVSGGRKWETLCGSLEEPMESSRRIGNVGLPNILTFM